MIERHKKEPILLHVGRIWDLAPHSGLTDLIKWKDSFYCVFRESDAHYGQRNGILRILQSTNGVIWNLISTLESEGWDLRDPKLSITPDGKMMLLAGASRYNKEKELLAHHTVVSFSQDVVNWSPLINILNEKWLWRITWFQGIGYGVAYFYLDSTQPEGEWGVSLYKTEDGIHYKILTSFAISGKPSEVTLRFLPDGKMIALLRRDANDNNEAWIGSSYPPYEDWIWSETHTFFGGPNFLILPDGSMWACGRILTSSPYGIISKTCLAEMTLNDLYPKLFLPGQGDTGYPGMVYEHPILWVSYYSSHEENTSVYIAKVRMD